MRLLFVGTNPGGGGTESHFVTMVSALAALGHDVGAVVRPDDVMHRAISLDPRVRLFTAEFTHRRDVRAALAVRRLVREFQPDWLIGAFKAEYWPLAVIARLAGVRLALFSHLDQRIRSAMLSPPLRLARLVIVPSQFAKARAILRGTPEWGVKVLHNPVDVRHFAPNAALRAEMRASLGLTDDHVLLGYVGRFETPKGVATLSAALARAMAKDSRLHMLWVGHGSLEAALRSAARDAGHAGRHHWMPWLADVLPAYAAMDVFALPSQGSETFGRVLVEAQSCGVPVLGADNGGIPEALRAGSTGLILPPGDTEAWAAGILDLVGSHARRRAFGDAGRRFALGFEPSIIASEFTRLLQTTE